MLLYAADDIPFGPRSPGLTSQDEREDEAVNDTKGAVAYSGRCIVPSTIVQMIVHPTKSLAQNGWQRSTLH